MLFVRGSREFGNLKSADLFSVGRIAILREAKEPAVIVEHAAAGPGDGFVAGNDRAGRMFSPGGSGIVGCIESQRIVLMRRGAGEEPPFSVVLKD